MFCFKKKLAKN